jgi:hypothetical protein
VVRTLIKQLAFLSRAQSCRQLSRCSEKWLALNAGISLVNNPACPSTHIAHLSFISDTSTPFCTQCGSNQRSLQTKIRVIARSIDFHWFPLIHQKNFPIKQASSSGIPGPIFRPLRMCVPTGHANKSCNRPPVWTFDGWTKKCFIICQLDICPLFVGSQTLIELIARKPSTTQVVSPSHYPQGRQRLARHRRSKRKTRHDMGHFSRGCYERLPN